MTERVWNIKVQDIVPFTEDNMKELKEVQERLKVLSVRYKNADNRLFELEEIKRELLGELNFYAPLYAKVRSYKNGQHAYLEDQRKRVKAEIMLKIVNTMSEGQKKPVSFTNATEIVYANEEYIEYVSLMEKMKKLFIEAELLYDHYAKVLDSIVQSISVASKEFTHSKTAG